MRNRIRNVKCRICKERKATIIVNGFHYCNECFLKVYERKVERLIKRFKLIRNGERVLVAVSGGKDSLSCAFILKKFEKKFGHTTEALHINVGIPKYSEEAQKIVKKFCKINEISLHVINVKETTGKTVRELAYGRGRPICAICGVVKRYLMNKFTLDNKFDKYATGHNMDDILEYFFKNWIAGDFAWIGKLKPITPSIHKNLATKIRPLFECSEKENRVYASLMGIRIVEKTCPYALKSKWKPIIDAIEEKMPGFKLRFVKSLEKTDFFPEGKKINECKICGGPTDKEICSFCRLTRS